MFLSLIAKQYRSNMEWLNNFLHFPDTLLIQALLFLAWEFTSYLGSASAAPYQLSVAGYLGYVRPKTVARPWSTAQRIRTWPSNPDFIIATVRSIWPVREVRIWTMPTNFGKCQKEWRDSKSPMIQSQRTFDLLNEQLRSVKWSVITHMYKRRVIPICFVKIECFARDVQWLGRVFLKLGLPFTRIFISLQSK